MRIHLPPIGEFVLSFCQQNIINFLFQSLDFFMQSSDVSIDCRAFHFPQPLKPQQFYLFLCPLAAQRIHILLHPGINRFFMNPVGTADCFSSPVVATADIFHPTVAVPVADHRDEHASAVPASEQSRIAVAGFVGGGRPGVRFQQKLHHVQSSLEITAGKKSSCRNWFSASTGLDSSECISRLWLVSTPA